MKELFILLCFSLLGELATAQTMLCITTDKTSSLVFPYPIVHVDRGAKSVLVQPVKDAPHILLVKAGEKHFAETNLSVITEDGSVYSFLVCYTASPATWVHQLASKKENPVTSYAAAIMDNNKVIKGIHDRKWNVQANIKGIYVQSDVLFLHLELSNQSPMDYKVDLLRLFIRDKRKAKRTAVQETEIPVLHMTGHLQKVQAYANSSVVIALPAFTIPDKKKMLVQLMEKNGGRHLQLNIRNNKLIKAVRLPDLQ